MGRSRKERESVGARIRSLLEGDKERGRED